MSSVSRVETLASRPPMARAIGGAASILPVVFASTLCWTMAGFGDFSQAQSRANLNSSGLRSTAPRRTTANTGATRFVSETGESFVFDRSGSRPLFRFESRQETWVLRPVPAPRGDIIYRNDTGEQILRVRPDGGVTLYSVAAPNGSPAALSGQAGNLDPPVLGPIRLFNLMANRSRMVSEALGRSVDVNLSGERSESLCTEAMIAATDAVIRMARSPVTRSSLSSLRSITIVEGSRASITFTRGDLRVTVDPSQGMAGRPSSARIIRAIGSAG